MPLTDLDRLGIVLSDPKGRRNEPNGTAGVPSRTRSSEHVAEEEVGEESRDGTNPIAARDPDASPLSSGPTLARLKLGSGGLEKMGGRR